MPTTAHSSRPAADPAPGIKLISPIEVCGRTSLSRPTIYRLRIDDPTFPKAIQISPRRIAFDEREIQAWIEARPAKRASTANGEGRG